MHGEREISCIWFVFRIWEYEVNYVDFICVTCILYVGLVENFKFAVKIQVWLSKLHTLGTGRLSNWKILNLLLRYKFG